MLKLEDFLSQTIKEIINGVVTAQEYAPSKGATVNPSGLTFMTNQGTVKFWHNESGKIPQIIHFDVAITAIEGTETKGSIGVFAGSFGLGSQGQSDNKTSVVSRIEFDLPILLPEQKI